MNELRWILVAAGLLLIAAIYALGLHARRRAAAPEHERMTRVEPARTVPVVSEPAEDELEGAVDDALIEAPERPGVEEFEDFEEEAAPRRAVGTNKKIQIRHGQTPVKNSRRIVVLPIIYRTEEVMLMHAIKLQRSLVVIAGLCILGGEGLIMCSRAEGSPDSYHRTLPRDEKAAIANVITDSICWSVSGIRTVFLNGSFFHRHSGASDKLFYVNYGGLAWRFPPSMAPL